MKKRMILSTVFILYITFAVHADTSENKVELMLASNLDEARGYCLDIAGGKGENAPVEKGLQAHTCYNYTGKILVDQGFDQSLITKGQFLIPYFNVCMSVSSVEVNSPISLAKCDQSSTQKFTLQKNGSLVTQENSNLCVTVSSTEKRRTWRISSSCDASYFASIVR